MNKLEVGMYVRTKWDCICKLININDCREPNMKYGVVANYLKDIAFIGKNEIKDASFNIIDLIEAGDIVVNESNNKQEVLLIDNELMVKNTGLIYDNNYYLPIKSIAIKSILTKEQFESMSYRIGG